MALVQGPALPFPFTFTTVIGIHAVVGTSIVLLDGAVAGTISGADVGRSTKGSYVWTGRLVDARGRIPHILWVHPGSGTGSEIGVRTGGNGF